MGVPLAPVWIPASVLVAIVGPWPAGAPDVATLRPGAALARQLAPDETHVVTVDLEPGELLDVTLRQQGADAAITLDGPAGTAVAVDIQENPRRPERLLWIAAQGGTHVLRIRLGSGPGGPYTLERAEPRVATSLDAERVAARRSYERAFALRKQNTGLVRQEALALLEGAEVGFRHAGDVPGEVDVLELRAEIDLAAANVRAALTAAQEALALQRSLGDRVGEAATQQRLSRAYVRLGQAEPGLAAANEALRLAREANNEWAEAVYLNTLGIVTRRSGDGERSLEAFAVGLDKSRITGQRDLEARILHNRGATYYILGEYSLALADYEKSVALWGQLGDRLSAAGTYNNMGNVYERLGDLPRARAMFTEYLDREREANPGGDGEARALGNLATTLVTMGDFEGALAHARRSLEISARLDHPRGRGTAACTIGRSLHGLGRSDEAFPWLVEALRFAREAGDRYYEMETLVEMARLQRDRGDLRDALRNGEQAVALTERLRSEMSSPELRLSYVASAQEAFDVYIDVLMRLHEQDGAAGHDAAALLGSEQARARVLLDAFVSAPAPAEGRTADAAAPTTLAEVRRLLLEDDSVLLEFHLGETRSFLWAVTRSEISTAVLPPRARIEAVARSVHELLTARQRAQGTGVRDADVRLAQEASSLSRLVLSGIASRLATDWKGKRLVVVAAGALAYVPLEVLPAPDASRERLLVLDHEIVYAPSASVLVARRREEPSPDSTAPTLALVADPVFEPGDPRVRQRPGSTQPRRSAEAPRPALDDRGRPAFSRLPFSRREADGIAALVPSSRVFKALDFQASRELVTGGALRGRAIIHFATHGVLDTDQPDRSGLVLSLVDETGARRDGYLRMDEIHRLRLDAHLIVLSACQTALGREIRGEGLVGLTRGFLHAGARTVLASLWQVDDESTAELMKRFYRALLKDGRPPAEALRTAQLEMAGTPRWAAPFHWAGFVVQGDWR